MGAGGTGGTGGSRRSKRKRTMTTKKKKEYCKIVSVNHHLNHESATHSKSS